MKLLSNLRYQRRQTEEFEQWLASQLNDLKLGVEIKPPWITYVGQEPYWGGWRQGFSEAWYIQVWLPFWKALSEDEQLTYVIKWYAPSEWLEFLLDPDRWFGRTENRV